jgi:hypothetical protein
LLESVSAKDIMLENQIGNMEVLEARDRKIDPGDTYLGPTNR